MLIAPVHSLAAANEGTTMLMRATAAEVMRYLWKRSLEIAATARVCLVCKSGKDPSFGVTNRRHPTDFGEMIGKVKKFKI
ncbi:hypothetical protein CN878_16130 [Ochrobactrum sp. 695/2009]|nr:hypothetical protein CN880_15325 [Ochrobactrum sp. 720/2009]PJT23330.1 hypothetical protein CN879_10770 [Ochrobactrum sp. 715/2009]PJT28859.1 hypothetical protein CN878_16130 [Ochrobactrum sp. 695/2009]